MIIEVTPTHTIEVWTLGALEPLRPKSIEVFTGRMSVWYRDGPLEGQFIYAPSPFIVRMVPRPEFSARPWRPMQQDIVERYEEHLSRMLDALRDRFEFIAGRAP